MVEQTDGDTSEDKPEPGTADLPDEVKDGDVAKADEADEANTDED